jgi:type I restriction enzyme R subunit
MQIDAVSFQEDYSAKLPALALLMNMGYHYLAPAQCESLRLSAYGDKKSNHQVMLLPVLRAFLAKQKYVFAGKVRNLSNEGIDKIIHELTPAMNLGLKAANEKIYNALIYGIGITEFIDGKKVSPTIQLIDWDNLDNNAFHVTEEFVVSNSDGTGNRIPDIVAFINGLPLVVIEAKRPASRNEGKSTNSEAISQHIRNQGHTEIPHLYAYSQLLLSINGHDGLYGTCGTQEKFWATWKEEIIKQEDVAKLKNTPISNTNLKALFSTRSQAELDNFKSLLGAGALTVTGQDVLIVSLLSRDRLIDMIRLFTLFDKKAGRIVARYQQVFGIKALIERVSQFDANGTRLGGVIWHTTGSGKSFTMVFLSKALIWLKRLAQCRIIIVTDRVDLEDQLSRTFSSGGALSDRDKSDAMATTGKRLAEQIGKGNERLIFSIINKFGSAIKHKECYNPSKDIIVLVDEGHRSQNGENNIRMTQTLPKAAFVAFTGTPLLKDDKTEGKFGKIIHSYTMQQAVEDGTVTPLLYEERIPELNVNEEAIDKWFERRTSKLTDDQKADLKRKFSQKGQIYQAEGRIELIAYDISEHFQPFKAIGLKGQLACDSKGSAIRYKRALDKIGSVTSVVAMSAPDTREGHDTVDKESQDIVQQWWTTNVGSMDEKTYTKAIIDAFSQDDGPDLMIVVDKLLTGFDEPKNAVLYIDKPLKQHNLIQAIARVNRLHKEKEFGYLIDYRGILSELDVTIGKYQDLAERTQGGFDIDDLKGLYSRMDTEYKKLPYLHKAIWDIFADVKNKQDGPALRQSLSPKIKDIDGKLMDTNLKKRDDFYAAVTAFSKCMRVALQSITYFEDKSFDEKRDKYKLDLKAFIDLRKQVREDANETIDYDEYSADIRQLLDKHIAGLEVVNPEGVYIVGGMGKKPDPDDMTDDEARNQTDKITGRISKMIEQGLKDDPYAKEYFSKLLKKAIEEARSMFNSPVKQYMMFADFEKQVESRNVSKISEHFRDEKGQLNKHAQAYYGLFQMLFNEVALTNAQIDNEKLISLSFEIDAVVKKAVAEFSISPAQIENEINLKLLPILFSYFGLESTQRYINEVLNITRVGLSGS